MEQLFPHLFSTGRIGGMDIKNRLLMAPMVRNYADTDGMVTDKYFAHVESIARGGVGALILEAAFISPEAKGFVNQLGIHRDDVVSGLRRLVETAHENGARIGPQIFHGGRQASSQTSGMRPVAPSAIPDPTVMEIPRELSVDEIRGIIDAYGQGARRAREAGCDFVEIHGAHGYLITQFLSEFSNKRTDEYGGSEENRMRFLREVVLSVRGTVGEGFPIIVRLSADELVPNGIKPEFTVRIARELEAMGVDALHISAGNYASFPLGLMIQPMAIPDAPLVPLAQQIKEAVGIPVIAVGKIRSPELAESIIRDGRADFIALGRPLLADQDWPKKAQEGHPEHINQCIACNQGCISRLFAQQDVWCTVNPVTARELEFVQPPPERKKRVLIAGGGPAGMEAARFAVGYGHDVTLFEKADHLGGQLISAAAAPYRPGWEELRRYLEKEMDRLEVDVRLNTELTPDVARSEEADAVIVAIGSHAVRPSIPGIQEENVLIARDVLEGRTEAKGRVVVAGGGCAGSQTAEYLAARGHHVTIVEMLGDIAVDAPVADRELLIGRLQDRGVEMMIDTRILSIEEGRVHIQSPRGLSSLEADSVVLCLGSAPNDHLAEELSGIVDEIVAVGDAVEARKVTEAMAEAALAARRLGGEAAAEREAA